MHFCPVYPAVRYEPKSPSDPEARHIQYPNFTHRKSSKWNPRVDRHLACLARVLAANALSAVTCNLVRWCIQHNTYFHVENRGRSFIWDTDPFVELLQEHPCLNVMFHHYQYGSSRRKLTRFWHNVPTFQCLEAYCQNDHTHEPWGQNPKGHWNTSEEAAYPWELCRSMDAKLLLQLRSVFALQEASLSTMRASTDLQPRRGLPPMVSGFKAVVACPVTCRPQTSQLQNLEHSFTGGWGGCQIHNLCHSQISRRICL